MTKLSPEEIETALAKVSGWAQKDGNIGKKWTFDGFIESMTFVNRVAELAEEHDHHPDISIRFNTVALRLSTHDAGGLTRKDFQLASAIDNLDSEDEEFEDI